MRLEGGEVSSHGHSWALLNADQWGEHSETNNSNVQLEEFTFSAPVVWTIGPSSLTRCPDKAMLEVTPTLGLLPLIGTFLIALGWGGGWGVDGSFT